MTVEDLDDEALEAEALEEAFDAFYAEGKEWAGDGEVASAPPLGAGDEDEDDDEEEEPEPEEEEDDDEDDDGEVRTAATLRGPRYPDPPSFLTVRQGDCLRSIAAHYRMPADTIWMHPENAPLATTRKPTTLLPGDTLFIPERATRAETAPTDRRHSFRLSSDRCRVTLTFRRGGEPRADLPYTFEVDGAVREGALDGQGRLVETIPPTARQGTLTLRTDRGPEAYPLRFGAMDPVEEPTGVQARLNLLGYGAGRVDGDAGPVTRAAILAFQRDHQLERTGEMDAAFARALEEAHGA